MNFLLNIVDLSQVEVNDDATSRLILDINQIGLKFDCLVPGRYLHK